MCTETHSQARAVPLPDRREATWKGREQQGLENELRPRQGMAWGWIGQGVEKAGLCPRPPRALVFQAGMGAGVLITCFPVLL